ncbi:MAG: glycerol-3-phosphate 1-O-acyltransferase PlsY [bacterium]|nr:glycerol-3-phosphate 1-O-acyltransferase PlsY [bacterium]
MDAAARFLLMLAAAYVVGSVPTAYLMGRLTRGIDIRDYGSGNVGATNVMRVLGTAAGLVTLGIDALKGYLVVFLVPLLLYPGGEALPLWRIASCLAVVAGHNWMLFLRFTGGKGVATAGGSFLALSPLAALSAVGVWGAVVACTRYVSLGSIAAGIALPVFMFLYGDPAVYGWFAVLVAAGLIAKHRENLRRLLAGTERRLGERVGE